MEESSSLKQVNRFLLCSVLIGTVLYLGRPVLVPITFSAFFAMLLAPLGRYLERVGFSRIWSSFVSLLVLMAAVLGIAWLVYSQSKALADELPAIEKKTQAFISHAQDYITRTLHVPKHRQEELVNKQLDAAGASVGAAVKDFAAGIFGWLAAAVLVLIFTFLFLYQREKYEAFFIRVSGREPEEARQMLQKISTVAQRYLTGRTLSVIIFTVLFTAGFLIVGLKNAFLLAFIAALLTIVPYIGSIVGGLFPFAVALVTEDSMSVAVGALAVILVIQGIDNYFIEPYIIGGEVNISGFFTILILVIGGLLWGVAGMILFLPMLGVAKIIFDTLPGLSAYGYLVGDQQAEKQSTRLWNKVKSLFGINHKK